MRIFVTGASGQLGSEIIRLSDHENFGSYSKHVPTSDNAEFVKLDVTNRENVINMIKKTRPDCVIHCVSEIKIDLCEQNKDDCKKTNVDGTRNVVDAAKSCGAKIIFPSTDQVFDGRKGNYVETDKTGPVNFYGETKLEGEKLTEKSSDYFIGRAGVMYSPKGNFTSWVLRDLKNGEVRAAKDLVSCPTFATEFAECLLYVLKKDVKGLYHTAGNEKISKYDFIRKFAKTFGFDSDMVKQVSLKDLRLPAKRPQDSSLNTSKIKSLGFKFSDVSGALKKLKEQLESDESEE